MPGGGGGNLHVALALRLGRPTSWTDDKLLDDVEARCLPLLGKRDAEVAEVQQFQDVPLPGLEVAS